MADTIREQIIQAYLTRLEVWTVANGYNYSCGSSVKRAEVPGPDELPAAVVWPGEDLPENSTYHNTKFAMVLKVEALAAAGSGDNKSVIQEKIIGDLVKILTDPDTEVTTLIDDASLTKISPANAQNAEETVTGAVAELTIKYTTKAGDPYSQ